MASYPPPIPLNQGLFNPASFTDPNEGGGLTIAQANSLFLRYPTAQGNETLQNAVIAGKLSTTNTDATSLVYGYGTTNSGVSTLYNTAFGYQAGAGYSALGTGSNNTAFGALNLSSVSTTATDNTAIGYNTLTALTTGNRNTSVGSNDLTSSITTGNNNTLVGFNARTSGNDGFATCIGTSAVNNTDGVSVGSGAGRSITTALRNIAIGSEAMGTFVNPKTLTSGSDDNVCIGLYSGRLLSGATARRNIAIGSNTLGGGLATTSTTTGEGNFCLGYNCGKNITTGSYNVGIGSGALGGNSSASGGGSNVCIGENAGGSLSGGENVMIGQGSCVSAGAVGQNVAVGRGTAVGGSDNVVVGRNATSVGVNNTIVIGSSAKAVGAGNVSIGFSAGINGGTDNVVMGENANGYSATARTGGNNNVCMGKFSGRNLNGGSASGNVGVGSLTLGGFDATTSTTGVQNTGVGYGALQKVSSGGNNVGLGYQALGNTTTGGDNIAIGVNAGSSQITGGNNTYVGRGADGTDGLSYSTAIGSGASATASNSITLGRVDTDAVRLNRITPIYNTLTQNVGDIGYSYSPTITIQTTITPWASHTLTPGVWLFSFWLVNFTATSNNLVITDYAPAGPGGTLYSGSTKSNGNFNMSAVIPLTSGTLPIYIKPDAVSVAGAFTARYTITRIA